MYASRTSLWLPHTTKGTAIDISLNLCPEEQLHGMHSSSRAYAFKSPKEQIKLIYSSFSRRLSGNDCQSSLYFHFDYFTFIMKIEHPTPSSSVDLVIQDSKYDQVWSATSLISFIDSAEMKLAILNEDTL